MIKEEIEIDFNTLKIFSLTSQDIKNIKKENIKRYNDLEIQIKKLGDESAKWQKLRYAITTLDIIEENPEQKLYIICGQNNDLIGYIKIGKKKLYLYDKDGVCHELVLQTILDFLITTIYQKKGIGHHLFEYVLKKENLKETNIAYDRPSDRLINFLKKHYNFTKDIPQYNNFMIFENFNF
ncbi:DUF738-domain-containing protein [Piromyces finnis]|uniref:DUF738-domain-containing protein n=1 Tax=Piromyces finnis TaxID=1754191 RepID=A0A1Y1VLC5_9FUNG|nr:DUF738-domain-containing protein [Piromyces finnis]|eukprot:ORX59093.1 DUF738-domain-containing protein [Piromyces finnis]